MALDVSSMNRVITAKGYAIKKESLTAEQSQFLRSQLTVVPKVLEKFQKLAQNFPIYYESKARFYVPRQWGIKQYGKPDATIISEGYLLPDTVCFRTTFPPHEFQKEVIEAFIARDANGLICVPCGYGKTFMALYIAVKLKRRFLIIVDKEFLMNQWKSEIDNFIEGVRVGILQADKVQIDAEKYDVTICMIQTICRREFPDGFFSEYGFTIFDECHHLGASYFSQALKKVQTRHMLGLSATPDREDGLSRVFEYFLGEAVYKNTLRAPDKEAVVKAVWFQSTDTVYTELPVNWQGETVTAKLLNQVAEFEPRNVRILSIIEEYLKDGDRFLLILSDRISQLEWFHTALSDVCKIGYYIGGMKQSKLDENADQCKVLLATYQMASEAFSVKKLNTVILATPRKNVQQSTGRIFRQRIEERKVAPHIIDIIDSHDCHMRRWFIRQKFYKECEYTIRHIDRPQKGSKKEDEKKDGFMFMGLSRADDSKS
jgi:superfamily II DNA or RNA helicase